MKKIIVICLMLLHSAAWAMESVEQGIRLFNQKEYQQAEEIFQQQSDNGNAYATYWLGVTQYQNLKHFQAGATFLKAAKMGDPWAMAVLAGSALNLNSPCNYLGWPCDEKWKDEAFSGWKKQVDEGNGKAILALRVKKSYFWELIPFYRSYNSEKIYFDAFQKGSNHAILKMGGWISDDKYTYYLKLAANQGYAPAMETLYYRMDTIGYDEAMKWINKAIELGYAEAARTLLLTYTLGEKDRDGNIVIHSDPKKAYYYSRLTEALGGPKQDNSLILHKRIIKDGLPVSDENGDPVFEILVAEQEQAEMDKQVAEFVKDIKPNLFLDETSIDLF
ncbi:sel1 repeat family protein [Vibrio fluvialis]|uniref:sel1 repeat family protein n=1 Tax=Vibrio fluvialis TaxID=676 RepID=UPI00192C211B|nr:sel1 repeat family protein [Vibrio fluvialis]MBL4240751.1 sel1 repeat family protein [Vibrio fluvialis]MBL4267425.1 sel1 repeat family protein [Vibrio fluvialis]MBL4271858.1 sel1 repeat family protein [Vibrio fluvialis]MBL4276220.1 sel1 repeat family protein [Vibrio fluvialis]MBO1443099.1 sel1 repeat family protein [Vibrio fluvialis]